MGFAPPLLSYDGPALHRLRLAVSIHILPHLGQRLQRLPARMADRVAILTEIRLLSPLRPRFLRRHFRCNPLHANSWGAFGGSTITLPALIIPILYLRKKRPAPVLLSLWGLCALVLIYMTGESTPLHYAIWKYMPFFSSFRGPGRLSMALPLALMLLGAWLVKPPGKKKLDSRPSLRMANSNRTLPQRSPNRNSPRNGPASLYRAQQPPHLYPAG